MSSLRFIVSVKRGLCLYLSGLAIVLKTTVPRFFILDKSARGQGTERKTITIKQLLYDYKKSSNQGIGTTDGMYGRCREEVSEFIHRTNNRKTFIIGKTKSTNFQNEKYKKIAFTHF